MFDLTTGGRIIFSVNCIGGVLKDMDSGMLVQISRTVDEIERELRRIARPGDIILTVGAGDVFRIGEHLLQQSDSEN